MKPKRELKGVFIRTEKLKKAGLTLENLQKSIKYTHDILDEIDKKLISVNVGRISQMIELANLSSMVGNLLGAGIEKFSNNNFKRNKPHKYPDILAQNENVSDIEIKISLETNRLKGHLAKEGYYLTFRYVLIDENFEFNYKKRGCIVQIWEARMGYLSDKHFIKSSTKTDSGKTATINAIGMEALNIIYIDLNYCPYPKGYKNYQIYENLINNQ